MVQVGFAEPHRPVVGVGRPMLQGDPAVERCVAALKAAGDDVSKAREAIEAEEAAALAKRKAEEEAEAKAKAEAEALAKARTERAGELIGVLGYSADPLHLARCEAALEATADDMQARHPFVRPSQLAWLWLWIVVRGQQWGRHWLAMENNWVAI